MSGVNRATVCMSLAVIGQIMRSVGRLPAETGGVLLGPIGENLVTEFFFDADSICTGTTYTPASGLLNERMQKEWLPRGLDMKGMGHSHPGSFDRLSPGDLIYIARLLSANPGMERFIAPIVIPSEFRVRTWVVTRESPSCPQEGTVLLVN